MNELDDDKGAGVKIPPPLLTLAVILAAYLLDRIFPLPIITAVSLWLGASLLIAFALLIACLAVIQFFRAKTHIEPWKPSACIIQDGVYQYSRNPIYLAFCIFSLGIGLMLNSWWIVSACLPLAYLLRRLVIEREEAYLEKKFGEEYLNYKNKVRRWI